MSDAMKHDRFKPKANITVKLSADSGYTSTETTRISADQWGRICGILAEDPAEPIPMLAARGDQS